MTIAIPQINTALPCSSLTLPTKMEYVQFYNDIAMIPSKINVYLAQNPDLDSDDRERLEDTVERIEKFFEGQTQILSPWWTKGKIRNWQKESRDAWSHLIDDYHVYIPVKMMELISDIIPVSFNISVMGVSVDLLKILERDEQTRIKNQISENLDSFYGMIPESFQYYKGEFGVLCNEWKAQLTWDYFKNEVIKMCTDTLHSLFGKLIEKFQDIWDALGLPSLPALLEFDVAGWIEEQIYTIKNKAKNRLKTMEERLESLENEVKTFVGDEKTAIQERISELKVDIQNFSVNETVIAMLKDRELFGLNLLDVLGGDVETNVLIGEVQIEELVRAARDWFAQYRKELINQWIEKVTAFFEAIGLTALVDLLTLTFCDVIKLLGVPMTIDLALPQREESTNGVQ